MVDYAHVFRVSVAVGIVVIFTGFGFSQQMNLIDDRRDKTFHVINRIKEEERSKRIAYLKDQGRL